MGSKVVPPAVKTTMGLTMPGHGVVYSGSGPLFCTANTSIQISQ